VHLRQKTTILLYVIQKLKIATVQEKSFGKNHSTSRIDTEGFLQFFFQTILIFKHALV